MNTETTTNNLADILKWLKNGDCVCVYTTYYGRCFYSEKEVEKIKGRMVYVDVNSHPGLLDNGEWESYIKREGNYELEKVPTQLEQGNKILYFSLGY